MNRQQAEIFLGGLFPGKQIQDAVMDLTKMFTNQLNDFIRKIVKDKNFDTFKFNMFGKKGTVDMESYPKNNAAEVLFRTLIVANEYPNATANYIVGRRSLDSTLKSETGEPITIMIVIGIIVALAPVVFPFVVDLVNSFIDGDNKKKKIEAETREKAVAEETIRLQNEQKTKTVMVIAGVVVVSVIGFIAYRRLA